MIICLKNFLILLEQAVLKLTIFEEAQIISCDSAYQFQLL